MMMIMAMTSTTLITAAAVTVELVVVATVSKCIITHSKCSPAVYRIMISTINCRLPHLMDWLNLM